jgi:hypothetical protein
MSNNFKYYFLFIFFINCSQTKEKNILNENTYNTIIFESNETIDLTNFSEKEQKKFDSIKTLIKQNLINCFQIDESENIYFYTNSKDVTEYIYIGEIIYFKMDESNNFIAIFKDLGSIKERFCFVEYKDNLKHTYIEGIPKTLSIGNINNKKFYNLLSTEKTNENIIIFISNCIFSGDKLDFELMVSYI